MPLVAGDAAAPRDLTASTATTIEMELQVGASPKLCTRRRAPPPVWVALELPPPRMHWIGSIRDGGGGGGRGIACNNERMAVMQAKNILQLLLISLGRPQLTAHSTTNPRTYRECYRTIYCCVIGRGGTAKRQQSIKREGDLQIMILCVRLCWFVAVVVINL